MSQKNGCIVSTISLYLLYHSLCSGHDRDSNWIFSFSPSPSLSFFLFLDYNHIGGFFIFTFSLFTISSTIYTPCVQPNSVCLSLVICHMCSCLHYRHPLSVKKSTCLIVFIQIATHLHMKIWANKMLWKFKRLFLTILIGMKRGEVPRKILNSKRTTTTVEEKWKWFRFPESPYGSLRKR